MLGEEKRKAAVILFQGDQLGGAGIDGCLNTTGSALGKNVSDR